MLVSFGLDIVKKSRRTRTAQTTRARGRSSLKRKFPSASARRCCRKIKGSVLLAQMSRTLQSRRSRLEVAITNRARLERGGSNCHRHFSNRSSPSTPPSSHHIPTGRSSSPCSSPPAVSSPALPPRSASPPPRLPPPRVSSPRPRSASPPAPPSSRVRAARTVRCPPTSSRPPVSSVSSFSESSRDRRSSTWSPFR